MADKNVKLLFYEFECGCKFLPGEISKKAIKENGKWTTLFRCPVHKDRLKWYIFECCDCGVEFLSKTPRKPRCEKCRAEHKKKQRRVNSTKARNRKAKKTIHKPIIDQTLRGSCKFGDYCRDRLLNTGKQFNCHGCKKFQQLEFDVMDYAHGVGNFTKAQTYYSEGKL